MLENSNNCLTTLVLYAIIQTVKKQASELGDGERTTGFISPNGAKKMILTCGKHEFNTKNFLHNDVRHGDRCSMELSYDKMTGIRRCSRHLYPMGRSVKQWAAIKKSTPETREIARIGFGPAHARFDKAVFRFSCQGYFEWVAGGAQYCELFTDDWPEETALLNHYSHGAVRKCKDTY